MTYKRLFQYQAKTEPVLVPPPPDTSAVEFAATSPSFSIPVRPLINTALLVGALTFVPDTAFPGNADRLLTDFIPEPDVIRPTTPLTRGTIFTGFGTPQAQPGDATELLTDFIQPTDVIRPLAQLTPSEYAVFVRAPVVVVVPDFGWYQALSEPVRIPPSPYVQEPTPLSTPFLPGDAAELREFIQLPDVIRSPPRVAWEQAQAIDFEVLVPDDLRRGWFQPFSEPVRIPPAPYVQEPTPLTTPFLPGDADQLREFIAVPDVIRPVARAISAPFLFLDPEPLAPEVVPAFDWFQSLSEPVRPLALTHEGLLAESLEPIALAPVPDFGWFQLPADVVRRPKTLTRGSCCTGFGTPLAQPGDATQLLTFIAAPDLVRPPSVLIEAGAIYVGEPIIPQPGDATELKEFIQLADLIRPLPRPVNQGGSFYVGDPIAPPGIPAFDWYQPLSNPVRPLVLPIHTKITGFAIPQFILTKWFDAFSEPVRVPARNHAGLMGGQIYEPEPIPPPPIPVWGYFHPFSEPARPPARNQAALVGGAFFGPDPELTPTAPIGIYIPTYRRRRR